MRRSGYLVAQKSGGSDRELFPAQVVGVASMPTDGVVLKHREFERWMRMVARFTVLELSDHVNELPYVRPFRSRSRHGHGRERVTAHWRRLIGREVRNLRRIALTIPEDV